MHITTIALVISIVGLASSFVLVGIVPSLISLGLGIGLLIRERSIEVVRVVAISFVGVILPIIMYLNTYGISLPRSNAAGENAFVYIITENYESLGLNLRRASDVEKAYVAPEYEENAGADEINTEPADKKKVSHDSYKAKEAGDDETVIIQGDSEAAEEIQTAVTEAGDEKLPQIFESLDSMGSGDKNRGGIISVAASDDEMPSYGGLPVGTMLVAQYFREDDHNCNPVLVLRNETGDVSRYECVFTARDGEGNDIATSKKTVEVVRDKGLFVFEGRFDKRQLGNKLPESYEFIVSKRTPYEKDMSSEVSVYTRMQDHSAVLTAQNRSSSRVKVDAYVLYFDGSELVDCMWMIPSNTKEVCIEPGSSASIRGDAYYRFDRVETFYTAYEAVGG